MKANPLACALLVLLAVVVQLPAQQPISSSGTNVPSLPDFATDAERKLFEDTKAKAEKGDAVAQFLLGWRYNNGEGIATNYTEAAKWYRKAANQNFAPAQSDLGVCYLDGRGVAQDYAEAVKWFHKAADKGLANAQFNLGWMYDKGEGVPKNHEEAAKWYRKAAEQGDASAQSRLGMMYLTADGIERNYSEAFRFFSMAAKQGDRMGFTGLSMCYDGGYGVPVDYAKAVEITRRFADAGDISEQRNLGADYEQGHGVRQDYVEAYKWYNLAAANEDVSQGGALEKLGFEPASKMRDHLAQLMTSEQIAEAQQLAREFKPHKESNSGNSHSHENPFASGTGFFITDDGYLISNYHVVKDATKVRLLTSAGLIDAKVVQVDAANDLALLKAAGRFAPLPITASRTVNLGGTVATVGFPNIGMQGFAPKLAP